MLSFSTPLATRCFFSETLTQNTTSNNGALDNLGTESNKSTNAEQTANNGSQLSPAVQRRLDDLIGASTAFHKNGFLKNYGSGLLRSDIDNAQRKAMLDIFFNYQGSIVTPLTKAEKTECYSQLINQFPGLTALIDSVYKPE